MDHSTAQLRNQKVAKTLLYFAWFIEVCAVITGLMISAMIAQDTYEKNKAIDELGAATGIANVIIAALPFVMVAIVELAKIPTAQAVYVTKHPVWKTLFVLALVFLATITFETALTGFERNYRNLNYQVTQQSTVLERLEERKVVLIQQNELDSSRTRKDVLDDFVKQLEELKNGRDVALATFKEQEALVSEKANNVQLDALQQEIQGLRDSEATLIQTRDKEIAELQRALGVKAQFALDESKRKQEELRRQLRAEEDKLVRVEAEARKAIADANIFTESGVRQRQDDLVAQQIARINDARAKLNDFSVTVNSDEVASISSSKIQDLYRRYEPKLDAISQKISLKIKEKAQISGVTQNDIDSEQTRINTQRMEVINRYNSEKILLETRKEEDILFVKEREARIQLNELEMRRLDGEIASVKSKINELAKDNQIYRFAKMFVKDAKTVADVPISAVDMAAKIWFGSLALVIAVTGIILALASQVVQDKRNTYEHQRSRGLSAGLRSLSLALNRRARRRPKEITKIEVREVIKEVPVDRVVFKEVAKEVVRKELIHVPFYTTDKKLVGGDDDKSK